MKTRLFAFCLLVGVLHGDVLAGGPEIELDKVHIDDVAIDERGVVLHVTGTVKLFAAKTPEDDPANGNAKWVTLTMRGGEIRYHGNSFDTASLQNYEKYHQRLLDLKGTDQHMQLWGTEATVTGGSLVTLITAAHVFPLVPQGDERRFSWKDASKGDADEAYVKSLHKSPSPSPAPSPTP